MSTERFPRVDEGTPSATSSTASYANAHVLHIRGPSGDRPAVYLPQGEVLIGRGVGADIRLVENVVSERHASILINYLRASIRDLHSTNGTYINRKIIEPDVNVDLRSGDVISIGRDDLKYELLPSGAASDSSKMTKALSLLESRHFGEAEALLRSELLERGSSRAVVVALARAQYGLGKFDEAARSIWPLLETMPNDFEALSIYGMALMGKGMYSEAIQVLSKALDIRQSPALRKALQRSTELSQHQAAGNSAPASSVPADGQGSLAHDLDVATGADSTSEKMRGELLYRWHRNILSLKSLWAGVLLLVISVIWLPRIANRNSAETSGYERILSLLPVLAAVLSVVLIIVAVLRAALTRYTVYERRIDFGTGIFYQRRNPIWLYDITDISLRRSPLLILTRTAAIDIKYDTSKKKAGSESIVAASSFPRMRDFMENLQERVLRERRAMKKMWI